jgi:hypothetical protein
MSTQDKKTHHSEGLITMTTAAWPLDCGASAFDALDPSTWNEGNLPAGYAWHERETFGEHHLITPDGTDLSTGYMLARDLCPAVVRPAVGERVICEYCDQPATRITRDSGEPLCDPCVKEQYGNDWRAASAVLTRRTRERYQRVS